MNLFDTENGAHIDRYDAVFRFNSEWRRMHHVTKDTRHVKLEDKGKYMGVKTTFRLVNRKYTTSLLDGDAASQDISPEEEVLFWNYFSAPYLRSLVQKHSKLSFHLAAADLINWEMEAFSLLRKDFYRLGLGPFDCYRFLSSGVHGIFMAGTRPFGPSVHSSVHSSINWSVHSARHTLKKPASNSKLCSTLSPTHRVYTPHG